MPPLLTSCPYCNAQVPVPVETAVGQRLICPRCGEPFAFRGATTVAQPASSAPATPPSPRRLSNRAVAAFVLGIMATMALAGLGVALLTQPARRAHDTMKPPRSELLNIPLGLRIVLGVYLFVLAALVVRAWLVRTRQPSTAPFWQRLAIPLAMTLLGATLLVIVVRPRLNPEVEQDTGLRPIHATPPAELAELGYLPDGVNLAAGVHIAEALETPAGKEALVSLSLPSSDLNLDTLVRLTGMQKPDELEHLLLGVELIDQWPPPMTLVIRTRRPYDPARLHETMPTTWKPEPSNKDLRGINLHLAKNASVQVSLWCADERTLVLFVSVPTTRINQVPDQPMEKKLSPLLMTLLRQRTGEGTPLWLVGQTENWPWKGLLSMVEPFVPMIQQLALMKDLRGFGVFVRLDEHATLSAAFECEKIETAVMLTNLLRDRTKGLAGSPTIRLDKESSGNRVLLENVQVKPDELRGKR